MSIIYIKSSDKISIQDKEGWVFNESPPSYFKFLSVVLDNYRLEGRELFGNKNPDKVKKYLFCIHGAKSNYNSLNSILYPLQMSGISSLSFNLSGHSSSYDIDLKSTSLKKNLQESVCFFNSKKIPIENILGFSLGGALALKVAQEHKDSVKRIILFAPALYTEKAYNIAFGSYFKKTISSPFSFLDSSSLEFLRTFNGKILLIIGEYDGLLSKNFGHLAGTSVGNITLKDKSQIPVSYYSPIPFEVISSLEESIKEENLQKIILKGCDHSIMSWLRNNPSVAEQLSKIIVSFLE